MNRYVCIHGHFYQPSRENPWLEQIESQDSAYPYHDWNERIASECYTPNTGSRILDSEKRIIDIVNNYENISFNFGPTLLSWMQQNIPYVYQSILDADKKSLTKFSGHGSSIAQAYNHLIMPLANTRDKQTQIIWGIKDFEYRFNRKPEGMWLPETAVDLESLDIMAEHGIIFTILAPRQAKQVRKIGDKEWIDTGNENIDTNVPYICRLPSGKEISIFFYNGPISQEVAFSDLLRDGENFANRLLGSFSDDKNHPQIVHIATDGETFGHHHRFGDMALAYCINAIESNEQANVTVYGEYLTKHPPTYEVKILENSAWSCIHGVERWKSDCGCCTGGNSEWNQKWRSPLRKAMDFLRDNLTQLYVELFSKYVQDPWAVRNDYIDVILERNPENINLFLNKHSVSKLSNEERIKAIKLLEIQRNAMLMYTSCGWFFDDVSGIETIQIMRYAARAIQLGEEVTGISLENEYIDKLKQAQSNIPDQQNAFNVYKKEVKPYTLNLLSVGGYYAISTLFGETDKSVDIYSYTVIKDRLDIFQFENQKMSIGKATLHSRITLEKKDVTFAAVYLEDHIMIGAVRLYTDKKQFLSLHKNFKHSFFKNDIKNISLLLNKYFGKLQYSVVNFSKDLQNKIWHRTYDSTLADIEGSFRKIHELHYPNISILKGLNPPFHKALASVKEFILNTDINRLLDDKDFHTEEIELLTKEMNSSNINIDKTRSNFSASRKINNLMKKLSDNPLDISLIKNINKLLKTLGSLPLDIDLWQAQNVHLLISKQYYNKIAQDFEHITVKDKTSWIEEFDNLGLSLKLKPPD